MLGFVLNEHRELLPNKARAFIAVSLHTDSWRFETTDAFTTMHNEFNRNPVKKIRNYYYDKALCYINGEWIWIVVYTFDMGEDLPVALGLPLVI